MRRGSGARHARARQTDRVTCFDVASLKSFIATDDSAGHLRLSVQIHGNLVATCATPCLPLVRLYTMLMKDYGIALHVKIVDSMACC